MNVHLYERTARQIQPIIFPGFHLGAGAFYHSPFFYAICLNGDCRYGTFQPGPREVVDLTGIAAGFRVRKAHKTTHDKVWWLATTDGTDSRIYRRESGAWALKETVTGAVCTDIISFEGAVAVFYGASTDFRYSTNDGTAWAASGKSGSADKGNFAIVSTNGRTAPVVVYCRNPNEVYFTESLSDTTSSTSSTIGDNQTENFFNSLSEDDTGVLLFGMKTALFSLDGAGRVTQLTRHFAIPPADAGGQSDRANFEAYDILDGRHYYVVEGYKLLEYYRGNVNEFMAPYHVGQQIGPSIPRFDLPINAIARVGDWLFVALGSKNSATIKSVTYAPGGADLVANTFGTTSELYAMRYILNEGKESWVCHGIILQCTDPLRYMWYDDEANYLYLASGDSELINAQQRRAYIPTVNPIRHVTGGDVVLNTGACTLETGRFDLGDPAVRKGMDRLWAKVKGLASGNTLEALYRPESDYTNATPDFTSLATWSDDQHAEQGVRFPQSKAFYTGRLQFILNGGTNTYGVMEGAALECVGYPAPTRWLQ